MATNEQESEHQGIPGTPLAENINEPNAEKEEDAAECEHKPAHGHHHSALYAGNVVHSVVSHVLPHHRDLDL